LAVQSTYDVVLTPTTTAAPGQDELVLSVAAAMEQVFGWQRVHPAMWQD
jgi:Asp-tRNA(Asn)/Glu-tRNA(Gln) amidotransferase A subunit family amidase